MTWTSYPVSWFAVMVGVETNQNLSDSICRRTFGRVNSR